MQVLAQSPLSPQAQTDIARIEEAEIDSLSGLSSEEKKARLSRMSHRDFLLNVAEADPGLIPFYQTRTHRGWGVGIDAVSALDVWPFGFPGFQGLNLKPGSAPHMDTLPRATPTGPLHLPFFPTEMPRLRGSWCPASSRREFQIRSSRPYSSRAKAR